MTSFAKIISILKYHYVKTIYGDHNNSKVVKETLSKLLSSLPADAKGLNIGAGKMRS